MESSRKIKVIFDIASFIDNNVTGIQRVSLEILNRFFQRSNLEIILICSLPQEHQAWRNLNRAIGKVLPFQSKETEYLELTEPLPPPKKSFLRICEDNVRRYIPENKLLNRCIETVRSIKWAIKAPPPLPPEVNLEHFRSPILERLCGEADIYFSSFYLPVKVIDVNPNIKKFLVLYDLIPLLFPKFYPEDWLVKFNPPWKHVTQDMFLFAISEQTKSDMLKLFPDLQEEQFTVIPLGADEKFCLCDNKAKINAALTKYKIPPDTPYILSIATLEIRKNFDFIIRCFALFAEKYKRDSKVKDCLLVLTGQKGWKDEKIYDTFKKIPEWIKRKIIFTGYAADEDLPFLYNGAKCFTYMSLYEGFGLPPLEAMQAGTPVIVSETSSLPEVVGDAGILLDPKDETALVDAFYRVLTDETLRKELTAKGLEQAKKFSWDRCVDIICEKMK